MAVVRLNGCESVKVLSYLICHYRQLEACREGNTGCLWNDLPGEMKPWCSELGRVEYESTDSRTG